MAIVSINWYYDERKPWSDIVTQCERQNYRLRPGVLLMTNDNEENMVKQSCESEYIVTIIIDNTIPDHMKKLINSDMIWERKSIIIIRRKMTKCNVLWYWYVNIEGEMKIVKRGGREWWREERRN